MRRIRKSIFERVKKMNPAQSDVQGFGRSRKSLRPTGTKIARKQNM